MRIHSYLMILQKYTVQIFASSRSAEGICSSLVLEFLLKSHIHYAIIHWWASSALLVYSTRGRICTGVSTRAMYTATYSCFLVSCFPLINRQQECKDAWQSAKTDMVEEDRMLANMHVNNAEF